MADDNAAKMGVLGVLIGALIVILVGGGILYATGYIDPQPANITIQQPAPAEPEKTDRFDRGDRRDDRRGDWRDGGRGDWRDGPDRRGDRDGPREERSERR